MKWLLTGDWHVDLRDGDETHLKDLLEFAETLINHGKSKKIKRLLIAGDFFHHRKRVTTIGIHYGHKIIDLLRTQFEVYMLVGNHDMYYRENRSIHSLTQFSDKVTVVENPLVINNILMVPWICSGEEYDGVIDMTKEYNIDTLFGHFEFSNFQMNDHYTMEHGQTHRELKHVKSIFTGHYHMHQQKDNVVYIGSPVPMDMNDANDIERGFIEFDDNTHKWKLHQYSEVMILAMTPEQFKETDFTDIDTSKVKVQVVLENDADEVLLNEVKELLEQHTFRSGQFKFKTKVAKEAVNDETEVDIDDISDIDAAVIKMIEEMSDIENIDKTLLTQIFKKAKKND